MSQLIRELGFTSIQAQGMTVAPYLVGWFMVFFQAWHSDRTSDRGWHVMASTFVSFVGYLILATSVQKSVGAAYFALFLVVGGNYSLFPLVMWVPGPSLSNFFDLTAYNIQELGSKYVFTHVKERCRNGFHCLGIELCFDVSARFLEV